MPDLRSIFAGVLLPAAITALVLVAGWRRSRHRYSARESRSWAGAPALAAGFIAGWLALWGWPGLPPHDAIDWLPWAAVPLAAAGYIEAYWRVPLAGGVLAIGIAVPVMLLLVAWPLLASPGNDDLAVVLVALTAVAVTSTIATELLAARTSAARLSALLWAVALPAAATLFLARSSRLAMIAGLLAAAQAGALGANLLLGRAGLGRGTVLVFGTLLSGLLASGLLYSELRAVDGLLLAAAPLAAWPARSIPRHWGWTAQTLLEVGLVLAVASVPALWLWLTTPPAPL